MLIWFVLTAMAVGFVLIDIRAAPVGASLYILGWREPFPDLQERDGARSSAGSTDIGASIIYVLMVVGYASGPLGK